MATKLTQQALGLIPYLGGFWLTKKMIEKTEFWDRKALAAFQELRFDQIVAFAMTSTPYYGYLLSDCGGEIPYLGRDDVIQNVEDLLSLRGNLEQASTSGSTGMPMTVYYEKGKTNAREWAFVWHMRQHLGYNPLSKCVVLMDYPVFTAQEGIFWYKAALGRWLVMSTYHMDEKNLPQYIGQIRKFKPDFIQCYTSSAVTLARFMRDKKVEPFPLKGILCSSESLFEGQREFIEKTFGCKVHCHYGHTEKCVLAYECPITGKYHVFPQYGYTEIIGRDGNHVKKGEVGEVVATGFNNWAMPLIRYRTRDYAQFGGYGCECGRNYMVLDRIEGRLQDYIVASGGSLVSLGSVVGGIHEHEWAGIKKVQFEQNKEGSLVVKIVKPDRAKASSVAEIVKILVRKRLSNGFEIKVEFVDDIPLTLRGKVKLLVQNLPIKIS
jgi:phenylacetate-CoA ligase